MTPDRHPPYILLTALETPELHQAWLAHRGALLDGEGHRPHEAGPWIIWRLFTGRHRELGGSARTFPSAEAARADARAAARQATELTVVTVALGGTESLSWYLAGRRGPVMLSHQRYARHAARLAITRELPALLSAAHLSDHVGETFLGHRDAARPPAVLRRAREDGSDEEPVAAHPPPPRDAQLQARPRTRIQTARSGRAAGATQAAPRQRAAPPAHEARRGTTSARTPPLRHPAPDDAERQTATELHVEVHFSTRNGEAILVGCRCPLGVNHFYNETPGAEAPQAPRAETHRTQTHRTGAHRATRARASS
ncbi:MAG TPA: hypothetical protein VGC45_12585 [Gryllotalpicola sp.]